MILVEQVARLGRVPSVALWFAAGWSLALLVAGFLVPVYSSESASTAGTVTESSATLVGANGVSGAVVLAVPLVVAAVVAGALLLRSRRGAMAVAWALTVLLSGLTLLSMLTIGILVVPVAGALLTACVAAPTRAPVISAP